MINHIKKHRKRQHKCFCQDKAFQNTPWMKIKKDWSHPDIWSSNGTPGPRFSLISCRMMKNEDSWVACKNKWFEDSCLLYSCFVLFQSFRGKKMKLAFSIVFVFFSLETNRKSILLVQIKHLQTENFCLGPHGGTVTGASTTKSPQPTKGSYKKEYIAISFLFFPFLCLSCSNWFYQHYFSSLRNNF